MLDDSIPQLDYNYRPAPGLLGDAYAILDMTALGRQEAWEEPKDRGPLLH
jgi:hypothetical protein